MTSPIRHKARTKPFILLLMVCYVCSIFSFTGLFTPAETGLKNIIVQLQRIGNNDTGTRIRDWQEPGKLVTNLLHATAEITCIQKTADGKQHSLVVHLDYSHLLPASDAWFACVTISAERCLEAFHPIVTPHIPETPPPEFPV